jgi:hypothetical protein
MVWHIFKKDWKLLWVFVITVASLHWIAAFITFKLGLFEEDAVLEMLSETVPYLAFFGYSSWTLASREVPVCGHYGGGTDLCGESLSRTCERVFMAVVFTLRDVIHHHPSFLSDTAGLCFRFGN